MAGRLSGVLAFLAAIFLGSLRAALASAFRGSSLNVTAGRMSAEEVRATMLDELMTALGHGNRVTKRRLEDIEEALRPMFQALPKNEHGKMDHAASRYALHRLFVLRHGMYVKGLEPGGRGWSGSASPTEVLDDLVPAYVQSLFEQRVDGHGLGVHELSVLAATLEHLVHDEAVARLRTAYEAHGADLEGRLPAWKVEGIVDTYMVIFLHGMSGPHVPLSEVLQRQTDIHKVYPSWPESQHFTRGVQASVSQQHASSAEFENGTLTFNATALVVEEVVERYGRWQDGECRDLKSALLRLEDQGTGRVLLKDFYGKALGGAWQFTESEEYLRDLGALDESLPARPSVIIPNYINSHSNCLASSSIFSVCCLNECEPLIGRLERELAAPEAPPERILEIVERLPSSSVQAPRKLPEALQSLLREVAGRHGGSVPLHGRLFAQWLHHAYPRECPYPHKAGTTNPMTADEWISENGSRAHQASTEEMRLHAEGGGAEAAECEDCANATAAADLGAVVAAADGSTEAIGVKPLLWTAEEELIAPAAPQRSWLRRATAMLAAIAALAVSLVKLLGALMEAKSLAQHSLPFSEKAHHC